MIVCNRCGKENQDHYKFCLGCGAELPRDAAHAPKSFTAPTPPSGMPTAASPGGGFGPGAGAPPGMGGFGAPAPGGPSFGAPAAASPPREPAPAPAPAAPPMAAAPAAGGQVVCSKCGTANARGFKFCGTCGNPLAEASGAFSAPAAPAPVTGGARRGSLVLIRPDGSEGDSFPLTDVMVVGREAGGLFASDSYLSPRHATFQFGGDGLTVTDEGSLNGVYVRIAADVATELADGRIFRIGQEILRFERLKAPAPVDGVELMGSPAPGFCGRICLVVGRETTGNCFPVPSAGLHLGRERGDILFPEDGYVSGLHCRIHEEGGRVMLTDVGSSNGTFVRLIGATPIPSGSLLLMGQQLFRVEY